MKKRKLICKCGRIRGIDILAISVILCNRDITGRSGYCDHRKSGRAPGDVFIIYYIRVSFYPALTGREQPKPAEIRFPLRLSGQFGRIQSCQDVIIGLFIDAGRILGGGVTGSVSCDTLSTVERTASSIETLEP